MRGQAAMEYMILFGISLALVAVLWATSSTQIADNQWDLQLASARHVQEKIVQTADAVYIQGAPARMYLNVDYPANIVGVYLENATITLELRWKTYLRNITAQSIANLSGVLPAAPGRHVLRIDAGPVVTITES